MAAPSKKRLLVLGSTGSIGRQTLDVARQAGGAVEVVGIAAHSSHELVLEQVRTSGARFVALSDAAAAAELAPHLPRGVALLAGPTALEELVRTGGFDVALHGVVGAAGLREHLRRWRTRGQLRRDDWASRGRRDQPDPRALPSPQARLKGVGQTTPVSSGIPCIRSR
jgi:1-deoxy-D-xylulose 5-phosphate reductoisomerase